MNGTSTVHRYRAFGLTVASCLPLPELLPANGEAATASGADIEIAYAEVPAELPDAKARGLRFQASPGRLLLQVDDVARYLVRDGRRIEIARDPAADDDDVRTFLLGSAVGALLHQREDLVLHASAIIAGEGGVAFLGHSGAGKSTLAAAFRKRGYPVLTDDLCVVRPGADGRMWAYPGFPQTKLWLDSLKQLDLSPEGLRRIRHKIEKRAVPLGGDFAGEPCPLRKLYVLRAHNQADLKLTPVLGPNKFLILKNHTYRFGFLAGVNEKTGHFQQAVRLASQVPLASAVRTSTDFRLGDFADLIEADFKA
jgi:hypothetical protein